MSSCLDNFTDRSVTEIGSEAAFVDAVFRAILLSTDVHGSDNIDPSYPAPGFNVDLSESVRSRAEYLRFFVANSARLYKTFAVLADAESKQLFASLILFRILGYRRICLPLDRDRYFACRERALAEPATPSALAAYPILHFEFEHNGRPLVIDCLSYNLFFSFHLKQYYFRRHNIVIEPKPGDILVDAGACYGDTALGFAQRVGPEGHVYTFEALPANQDLTEANIRRNPELGNVTLLRCAMGSENHAGTWPDNEPLNPGYRTTGSEPMRSLDSLVAEGVIPRVDFIKMDIEGAELDALHGAAETIRRFRPRLAISVYHRPDDYYTIRELITELVPQYSFYLENYTISDGETVLYGSCEHH